MGKGYKGEVPGSVKPVGGAHSYRTERLHSFLLLMLHLNKAIVKISYKRLNQGG